MHHAGAELEPSNHPAFFNRHRVRGCETYDNSVVPRLFCRGRCPGPFTNQAKAIKFCGSPMGRERKQQREWPPIIRV